MKNFIVLIFTLLVSFTWAQSGKVNGKVFDVNTNEPLSFATVILQNTNYGAVSNELGEFNIDGVPPGLYNLQCAYVGYQMFV
ncbi:MAG: hypothetical protein RL362_127, partial [Bacteroidota bacterium]